MRLLKKKALALWIALVAAIAPAWGANSYGIPDAIQEGNILHCFDWTFSDIQAMLPEIAQAGFGAVQVSPVQGNCLNNAEWYYAYMPYDFVFKANGSGGRAQLQSLCAEAQKYGIKVIVDVVANHINKASGYHDTWWDSNGRLRWNGQNIDYSNRYSITHNQLGDYGDVNSESAEVQARAVAFINDLKSLGVSGIRWDAAKHIGLPSESCQFWPQVCGVAGMWHYGEILDGPVSGGSKYTLLKEYCKYMSVTDTDWSNSARNSVKGGSVPSSSASWSNNGVSASCIVYWGESHDTYSNESQETTHLSQGVIDRTWALGACRQGATSLYFSRPSATTRNAIKMGQKGSTHFTSAEIAAVNHLRNAMGTSAEYYTTSNGVACITRQAGGACIVVGNGQSRSVSVSNGGGYVAAGTYKDEVSGNTFTVTSTTISGTVGATGIAVIMGQASHDPSITLSPAGGNFTSETLSVTAKLVNATSGWVKVDGGEQQTVGASGLTFTIGAGVAAGSTITVSWSATGSEGTKTGSATFKKVDASAQVTVYFDPTSYGWSNVNCYMYLPATDPVQQNANWPGMAMTKGSDGIFSYVVPEGFTTGSKVIFNNGTDQYPQDVPGESCGLDLNGTSMILRGTTWTEYDGQGGGGGGGGVVDPNPVEPFRIYWDNSLSTSWTTPLVHYWGGSASTWPGVPMTHLGGNIWKYAVPEGTTGLVFNDGQGTVKGVNQTEDLTAIHKHIYNLQGDQGEWSGAGIEDVTADTTTWPVEYYTLQGVRVAQPAAGVYIRRQGSSVSKVYIR